MDTDLETLVRELADKQAITECIYRYCRGLDRLDWPTLQTVYHPDAIEDRGEGLFVGPAEDLARAALKSLTEMYTASQHLIGNILIDLDGDAASAESYFQAYHRYVERPGSPPSEMIMAGRYIDRFERRNGEWRIARRKMALDWTRTQPVLDSWLQKNPRVHRGIREVADSRALQA